MLWEIEIVPKGADPEAGRVREEFNLLTHSDRGAGIVAGSARGYLFEGDLERGQVERLMAEVLVDPLAETCRCGPLNDVRNGDALATVLLKPGVMDPVAMSVLDAARDLDIPVVSVRTFRRYFSATAVRGASKGEPLLALRAEEREILFRKVLANEAIEQIVDGPLTLDHLSIGAAYTFRLVSVPLRQLDDNALVRLSRDGQLALNLAEMGAIQKHYRELGRDPTDVELETLAQTWSEHCSHKTLKGPIDFRFSIDDFRSEEERNSSAMENRKSKIENRKYHNLLKETIFAATQEIRRQLGPDDWCVSVFEDNAGVVRFDEKFNVCFKVETHNHPSAIEPYGGANTGIGGVIRDPLGTGLGAKPICNTDVFCFAPPDLCGRVTECESESATTDSLSHSLTLSLSHSELPSGVLHPKKVMKGVVAGVRDYGNRMGIPTVNGAVCFDERYLANPLVFCGTVGLIPVDRCHKEPRPGDLIVVIGGRTGRDGIHGATFSSIELTAESEKVSGGAVQIGNAITEKKMLDVILQARDRGLYHAITDCGAGGFSSAVGEMGAKLGAEVHLDKAPLKYEGLSYTEIWISEAQERMVLAVSPPNWQVLKLLCESEDVEATVIGKFEATGRLRLYYQEHQVADLDMHFLHEGRPTVVRLASLPARSAGEGSAAFLLAPRAAKVDFNESLLKILFSYNVCSKEWIIRQYDHEVQGGTVLKPLVGVRDDGPGDAAVITPVLGSWAGLAIGCGINPRYGDLDPYWMAASAVDEAVRNVVAVGAHPSRVALLGNFCWGNTERPEVLGSLVRAAEACRDVALAYNMPFISGKDSLNNEYHSGDRHIVIPPTLLISALGLVTDVRKCVTMDLKEPGNLLFLVGVTKNEMGGSHYNLVNGIEDGEVPKVDPELAPRIFRNLHEANQRGLVRSCHDLSEGGLAAAIAEMAFAGGVGADVTDLRAAARAEPDEMLLFSESQSRFLLEVQPDKLGALRDCFGNVPLTQIGQTVKESRVRIGGGDGEWIVWASLADLREAWQQPLRW